MGKVNSELSKLADKPAQLAEWVEENAGKPKPGWLLLCWFCPSASTTAKVGRHPLNLSSRPEESWALGPPKGMKNAGSDRSVHPSVTAAQVSANLPFVIPRSRLACGKLRVR